MLTRRATDVICEAFFIAMSGDHDDELAEMDHGMIAVATMISMDFNSYASFFFFEHKNTCYTSVRFVLPYISL